MSKGQCVHRASALFQLPSRISSGGAATMKVPSNSIEYWRQVNLLTKGIDPTNGRRSYNRPLAALIRAQCARASGSIPHSSKHFIAIHCKGDRNVLADGIIHARQILFRTSGRSILRRSCQLQHSVDRQIRGAAPCLCI